MKSGLTGRLKKWLALTVIMAVLLINSASALAQVAKPNPRDVVDKLASAIGRVARLNNAEADDMVSLLNGYLDLDTIVNPAEKAKLLTNGVDQAILESAVGVVSALSSAQRQAIRDEIVSGGISNTTRVISDLLDVFMAVPGGGTRSLIESLKTKYDVSTMDVAAAVSGIMDIARPTLEITDELIEEIVEALETSDLVKTDDNPDGKIPIQDLRDNGLNRTNAETLRQSILADSDDAARLRRVLLRTGFYKPEYTLSDQAGTAALAGLFEVAYGAGVFGSGAKMTIQSGEVKGSSTLRFLTSSLVLTFDVQPASPVTLKLWARAPFNFGDVTWSRVGVYKKSGGSWVLVSGSGAAKVGDDYVVSASVTGSGEYAVAESIPTTGGGGGAAPVTPPVGTVDDKDIEIDAEPEVTYTAPAGTTAISLTQAGISKLVENEKALVMETDLGTFKIPLEVLKSLGPNASLVIRFEEVEEDQADELVEDLPNEYSAVGGVIDLTIAEKIGKQERGITLARPVRVTFSYAGVDLEGIDADKLGVYYYNETTKQWEYMGGKVDKQNKTIEFYATHMSIYAIMAYQITFEDIGEHWAKTDIEVMASKHVIKGVSDKLFEPERNINRAEFAALLVRTLGLEYDESMEVPFEDVADSAWFYKEAAVAYNAGLIKGVGDEMFMPLDAITREQMAVMISRALTYAGKGITLTDIEVAQRLSEFADDADISAWARAELAAAIQSGIVKGRTTDTVCPIENATRAESATMIRRMFDKIQ